MDYKSIENVCDGVDIMSKTSGEFGAPLVLAMVAQELILRQVVAIRSASGETLSVTAQDWANRCGDGLNQKFMPRIMAALREAVANPDQINYLGSNWLESAKRVVHSDDLVKKSRV